MLEELCLEVKNLADVIANNSTPLWLTVVGIFVPIILSALVLAQTIIQNKRSEYLQVQIDNSNKTLQNELQNKSEQVQMRGEVLKIYETFYGARNIIGAEKGRISLVFSNILSMNSQGYPNSFVYSLNNVCFQMQNALARAKLIFPESDARIIDTLEMLFEKVNELTINTNTYLNSGEAYKTAFEAQNTIAAGAFPQEQQGINTYNLIISDKKLLEKYWRLCSSDTVKSIENEINVLLNLYEYEKFDACFAPYLRMK